MVTTKRDYVTIFIHMEVVWIIYIWKTVALLCSNDNGRNLQIIKGQLWNMKRKLHPLLLIQLSGIFRKLTSIQNDTMQRTVYRYR